MVGFNLIETTPVSSDEEVDNNIALCPFMSSEKRTINLCWTCSILCCCFPLCYPCYLSKTLRERRQRKKLWISRNLFGRNRGKYDITRGTCTMNSEQSSGTSGYETLSRRGTLVSGSPTLDMYKVNQDVWRELEVSIHFQG